MYPNCAKLLRRSNGKWICLRYIPVSTGQLPTTHPPQVLVAEKAQAPELLSTVGAIYDANLMTLSNSQTYRYCYVAKVLDDMSRFPFIYDTNNNTKLQFTTYQTYCYETNLLNDMRLVVCPFQLTIWWRKISFLGEICLFLGRSFNLD